MYNNCMNEKWLVHEDEVRDEGKDEGRGRGSGSGIGVSGEYATQLVILFLSCGELSSRSSNVRPKPIVRIGYLAPERQYELRNEDAS